MQCSRLAGLSRSLCALVLVMLGSGTAIAQTVSFSTTTYAGNNLWSQNGGPNGHIRADLNGDGREDFISENDASWSSGCTGSFAVTLSTGDGAYAAPVCYTIPAGVALYFAAGDFSRWGGTIHDAGNLDIAVTNDQGNLYIYRNANGDGVLTLFATFTLAGEASGLVAADVNYDGFVDLVYDVTALPDGGGSVHVLFGQGNWNFTPGPTTPFTMNEPAGPLAMGNFDGDDKTDLMVTGASQVEAEILYGDGTGQFVAGPDIGGNTTRYQLIDPNSDGTGDLIGSPFQSNPFGTPTYYNYLDLEIGHFNRTLTAEEVPLNNCTGGSAPAQMADFDGDNIPDLIVAEAADCQGNEPYTLNFMKGNGDGTFQPEQVIYSTNDTITEWHVLRASHSSKPDLTVWQSQVSRGQSQNPEELLLVNTTSGAFPSCTPRNYAPKGINICGPTSSVGARSPVTFSFAGTNQTPARDMEIWVDGKKMNENLMNTYSNYSAIQDTIPLSKGQHEVTVYAVGWDYSLVRQGFYLLVGSDDCQAPKGALLQVCSPMIDTTLTSPVLVYAAGRAVSGATVVRMEVWVDGVKMYTSNGPKALKTYLDLAAGMHQFDYYVFDTAGTETFTTVYAAVQ